MSTNNEKLKHFSGSFRTTTDSFRVVSMNIEGLTPVKGVILAKIIKDNSIDILVTQETHCDKINENKTRFRTLLLISHQNAAN